MEKKKLGKEWENASLSYGTMIAEDVFEAVKELLPENLKNEFINAGTLEEKEGILYENIWYYLNEIAPEGFYFGSHPGNGSDYGFWEYEED